MPPPLTDVCAAATLLPPPHAGVGMRARAGYVYIRGEFVAERYAVMRAIGGRARRVGRGMGATGFPEQQSPRMCSLPLKRPFHP